MGLLNQEETCSICIDPIALPSIVRTICVHKFHRNCLLNYFQNQATIPCPNCRTNLRRVDYFPNPSNAAVVSNQLNEVAAVEDYDTVCCLSCIGYVTYLAFLIQGFNDTTLFP